MKKMILTLMVLLTTALSANAMSYEQARNEALFLTDKMAYELNLTDEQYEAAYEINLDYLMGVTSQYDVFGTYWERRNLDLSYILYSWQWDLFRAATYFYRPLYWDAGYWHFGIYARYPRRDYFYFGRPHFYATYRGGHSWRMNGDRSFYLGRSNHYRPDRSRDSHFGMRNGWDRGDYRGGNSRRFDNRDGNHGGNGGGRFDNRGGNGGYNNNHGGNGGGFGINRGNQGGNRNGDFNRNNRGSDDMYNGNRHNNRGGNDDMYNSGRNNNRNGNFGNRGGSSDGNRFNSRGNQNNGGGSINRGSGNFGGNRGGSMNRGGGGTINRGGGTIGGGTMNRSGGSIGSGTRSNGSFHSSGGSHGGGHSNSHGHFGGSRH